MIRLNEPDFNKDGLFRNLLTRWPKGDVLITVATGEMSDSVADHTGLVPTHAYAVLDIKQIDVSYKQNLRKRFVETFMHGKKLMKIKLY